MAVITFESDADRLYYVKQDPVHQESIKFLDGKLGKGIAVLDFIDGVADTAVGLDDC